MAEFAVIVTFDVETGSVPAFLQLVEQNAASSLRDEPGCTRFDVLTPRGEPGRVVLYEVYADPAAFDAHCSTSHFSEFDERSRPLVHGKQVLALELRHAIDPPTG